MHGLDEKKNDFNLNKFDQMIKKILHLDTL